MSGPTPSTPDRGSSAARLRAVGEQLKHLHLERLRLMEEAGALARRAAPTMSVEEIARLLGLAPATVRGFGVAGPGEGASGRVPSQRPHSPHDRGDAALP